MRVARDDRHHPPFATRRRARRASNGRDRDRRCNCARCAILRIPSRPPSRALFVTQSLDASRSKLVTKGKEKKTKHRLSRHAVDSDLSRRVDELIIVFVLLPSVPESHHLSSTLELRFEAHLPSLFPFFCVVQTSVASLSAPICFVLEIVLLEMLLTKLTKARAV